MPDRALWWVAWGGWWFSRPPSDIQIYCVAFATNQHKSLPSAQMLPSQKPNKKWFISKLPHLSSRLALPVATFVARGQLQGTQIHRTRRTPRPLANTGNIGHNYNHCGQGLNCNYKWETKPTRGAANLPLMSVVPAKFAQCPRGCVLKILHTTTRTEGNPLWNPLGWEY